MTEHSIPDLVGPVREATNRTLAALDVMVRHLKARPGSSEAMVLEAQREIILSLGQLSELVAEVGENQSEIFTSPQGRAAIRQGAQMGVEDGLKRMVGGMPRRTRLQDCLLAAGMFMLGGVAMTAGFAVGSRHEYKAIMADCLRDGVQLTLDGERVCAILMAPR